MIECAIIGDSIAVGVSRLRSACHSQAVVGISSESYAARFVQEVHAGHVLISLGSNDSSSPGTETAMRTLRRRVNARQVTWLLSANNQRAADIARRIAIENGDRIIEVRAVVGPDGVHPTSAGYYRLSAMWRIP